MAKIKFLTQMFLRFQSEDIIPGILPADWYKKQKIKFQIGSPYSHYTNRLNYYRQQKQFSIILVYLGGLYHESLLGASILHGVSSTLGKIICSSPGTGLILS
jgi:hypothetical protein